jgi:hypothetical protein
VTKPAEVKPLLIQVKNPETRGNEAPMPFEMVELSLSVEELLEEDPARHYKPMALSLGGTPSVVHLLAPDKTVLDDADLD